MLTTKSWGLLYIDNYPFLCTAFFYDDRSVKVRLLCKYTKQKYQHTFSSHNTIIDDHMLFLKTTKTKKELLAKGYIHVDY